MKPPALGRRRVLIIVIVVLGVAALVLIFGLGAYRYGWNGAVTRIVSKVVPYPAALVDGQPVPLSDFQEDVALLESFYKNEQAKALPGARFPDDAEVRKRVLDRLIKERLAANLAARYGIGLTDADLGKAYASSVLDQQAKAEETLRTLYGLSPDQFKTRILKPYLLRQKLEEALRKDDALNAEKRKKAEAALAELKAGKPFKDVAKAYSEDPVAAAQGGDRGYMTKGLLPPEVEKAAFAMKAGEVSGVISSAYGYHVIKVIDRKEEKGQVVGVSLQEILVKPVKLDDYLDAQLKKADVVTFVH